MSQFPPRSIREHFGLTEKRKVFCDWYPCRMGNLLCLVRSRAATRHGTQKVAEITVVAVPTIVISNFHRNPIGMAQTYLSWTNATI